MERPEFYNICLKKHIKDKNSKIIVFGAGTTDVKIFNQLDFKNVAFSNLNPSTNDFIKINVHDTKLKDSSYDYCVAHASIHHSSQPHRAIIEMYRVARKGVLIIESNDSLFMKIAVKLKFAEEYEISAVKNGSTGVDETFIPNYVYRWTEREIEKLIKSYKPNLNHKIVINYNNHIRFTGKKFFLLNIILKIFFFIFKKQQNLISIFINKNF